jgi:glycosyltransferase involved in cell wall biosynthesis
VRAVKILVLAPQWPDPPRQGAAIRNLHILGYLASRHRVTLATFEPGFPVDREPLEHACEQVIVLPPPRRSRRGRLGALAFSSLPDMAWRLSSGEMRHRLAQLVQREKFDAVHVEGIEMAPYGELALELSPRTRMTYDAHNAEYLLQRRAFTTDLRQRGHLRSAATRHLPRAVYSLIQWWRLRRYEGRLTRRSKHVIAVSPADQAALEALSPFIRGRTRLLPNGVDPDYWSRDAVTPEVELADGDNVVFDGTMDFRPNVDAVLWFVNEVWPTIHAERPHARFYIVGRNPVPEVAALAEHPGVIVTGAVEDTRTWVAGATVYVVPMRMGGGVRLKVLQAMSMGCAIVSTSMGAEGIEVRPGKDMLMSFSPQGVAQAVLLLLSDRARRRALGASARELVTTRYTWEMLLPALDDVYPPER